MIQTKDPGPSGRGRQPRWIQPVVTTPLKGRNKPRRQDRRWATSWSPWQFSHRLRSEFPEDESMRISHEAIYQTLSIQGCGALRRELVPSLRTGRALRVSRAWTADRGEKFVIEEVLISRRQSEAEDRSVPGHWEWDRATRSCTNLSGLTDWRGS
jgi:IS30 family transposase